MKEKRIIESVVLTKENVIELQDKQIFCWGLVQNYLLDVIQNFELGNRVTGIIDNSLRVQGKTVELGSHSVKVFSPEKLKELESGKFAIVITCDYNDEILTQIMKEGYLQEKICKIYRYVTKKEQIDLSYRDLYKQEKLQDIIIFRSGPIRRWYVEGADFWDNSRALFEYMLEQGYNKRYRLVWLVKNPEKFTRYKNIHNVEFLSFDWEESENQEERDRYYHALCLAKYIFTTDAYDFARNSRKEQIRIQLWHGCGLKTRVLFLPCEHRYDYTTVISDLYADIHAEIYGLRKDQVLVTGYAKHDWLFSPYEEGLDKVLGIRKSSKYIFWLPTFRIADDKLSIMNQYELNPETGLPMITDKGQLDLLNDLLKEKDITMIIKLHPVQKNTLVKELNYSNIVLFKNIDLMERDLVINRLLASADALISDYSSTAVDYLVLDRPIGFTLDDVDEYENSRGFVFDNIKEWLPGKELYKFSDFCDFIEEVAADKDSTKEKRCRIADKMLKYRDNQNCKRILEAFGIDK